MGAAANGSSALAHGRAVEVVHHDLLRMITCGSVDDGKSTLIGRLLYDTKSIFVDQWEAVHRTSIKRGDARVDLALLTDGLRAEREQGITIDVAYRYFSTPRRNFILADTPGHVQYTRNMATGASTADLAAILIDARQGVLEQTRRHATIAAMLGVRHLVLCVNKMDLVGFDRGVFESIVAEFRAFTKRAVAGFGDVFAGTETTAIPIAALLGDNVVERSKAMAWFDGPTVLEHIETVPTRPPTPAPAPTPQTTRVAPMASVRLPVQWVVRPQDAAHADYRAICGQIAGVAGVGGGGELRVGDDVVLLPSGRRTRVARMHVGDEEVETARAPMSVSVVLEDDVDASRGEMLVPAKDVPARDVPTEPVEGEGAGRAGGPRVTNRLEADVVWMHARAMTPGRVYLVKHTTRTVKARLSAPSARMDFSGGAAAGRGDGAGGASAAALGMNDIGRVTVQLASPIVCDAYRACRVTGAFIVIDEASNETVGAGMVV